MQWIQVVLALLEAIPILDKWFQDATIEYVKKQKEKNNQRFLESLTKAKGETNVKDIAADIGGFLGD